MFSTNVGRFFVVLLCLSAFVFFSLAHYYFYQHQPLLNFVGVFRMPDNFASIVQDFRKPFITPTNYYPNETSQLEPKVILVWTGFYGDRNWDCHVSDLGGRDIYLPPNANHPYNRTCYFTADRSFLKNASGVVFHGLNMDFDDLPKTRLPNQRWVFFMLESPIHSQFSPDKWQQANQIAFNWTMYYTYASDSRFAYGQFLPANYNSAQLAAVNERITAFAKKFSSKPYDAVWIVSNCGSSSGRSGIVEQMVQAGLNVDRWGGCFGRKPDNEWKTIGEPAFFSRYRFQFALENSLCDDYATEKLFNAAKNGELYGVIPVVLGGGNYSKIFRPGSFIQLKEPDGGSSPKDIVALLKRLGQPDQFQEVRKYFEWQLNYVVDKKPAANPAFHILCENLWDKNLPPKTIDDLRTSYGQCHF